MRLQVVGCGDAFGSGGRSNACYLLQGDSASLLLDCGPGSLAAMKRLGIRPATLDAVLVTHLHGDHFGGIPFLFLENRYRGRRDHPLWIAGPAGLEQQTGQLADALYSSGIASAERMRVRYRELRPDASVELGAMRVTPFAVRHAPGFDCLGLRVEMDGKTVVYSGDTEWFDGLVEASRGADLMLLECTHVNEDGGYHMRLDDVLNNRHRLECEQLLLVHLGEAVLEQKDQHDLPWADDGMVIEI